MLANPAAITVLTPTTSPHAFANGPAEFPGASRSWLTTQEWPLRLLSGPSLQFKR